MKARQAQAAPAKKLTIKLARAPELPAGFEESTWQKLRAAVCAVQEKRSVGHSLEELYRAVEDLCTHKMGMNAYNNLQSECMRHATGSIRALAEQSLSSPDLPRRVHAMWEDYCQQLLMIRNIFLYLDRAFVMHTPGLKPIWDMGLHLFGEQLARAPAVAKSTTAAMLGEIERERSGEHVDRTLLRGILRMYSALHIYEESFERALVAATTAFYSEESSRLIADLTVPEYLAHADRRLEEEVDRVHHYLHPSTRKALLAAVQSTLLEPHAEALVGRGFAPLAQEGRDAELARMYRLMGLVGEHKRMREAWVGYIKSRGQEMVHNLEKEATLVQDLIDFKARCEALQIVAFGKAYAFGSAMREGFEAFINTRQNRPAELVAKYIDGKLRGGTKGASVGSASDEDLDVALEAALSLFRYISGKDMFEAFYKKDLAKRLLLGKSASVDAEKAMLSKLKAECGAGFTNKLEGMFRDMDTSADALAAFKASPEFARPPPLELDVSVHVLTTGFWPHYPLLELKLPAQFVDVQQRFEAFYMSKHSGRRLTWCHQLGQCLVKAAFPGGEKDLQVSLLQTCVLLLFNERDEISLEDVAEATGIEDQELRLQLQSLACGKIRVLNKTPRGRDVVDGDTFAFNEELSHKARRLKINSIQIKETAEENEQTTERVFNDRQYQIDAGIVRIMKSRKTLSHQLLTAELFAQLKFPLKPADLKKRIESLIDREYLERDPSSPQIYRYLA